MKKITIYKAFPAYQIYLNSFYNRNENLKNSSFERQKEALVYDGFPWILSWGPNITDKNVSVFETVHDCEWLQKSWNKNNKYGEGWQIEIVLKQIKTIQPNIIVLYPPEIFKEEVISQIRNSVRHEIIIVGYDGMNRKREDLYTGYDLIITCSKYISEYYKQKGILTYSLNFGFDKNLLNRINVNKKPLYNVGFSGSVYSSVHDSRYELMKYLTKKTKLAIRSEFAMDRDYSLTSKYQLKKLLKKHDISNYLALWRIAKMNKGPVFGINMYQFFNDTKIGINMHGDNIHFAANVRMYEITGAGSCLLTDWKENIEEIFIPDKEVVIYRSKEEAYDKIKFLLKNDRIRSNIAQAGQKRTLKYYNYKKRISDLMEFFKASF